VKRIDNQPGFILKSQAFKETSVIHQVFTRDYGLLSVISKGSRTKNSKHGSLLQPFRSLLISWVGKSDLKTLVTAEDRDNISQLSGSSLYCGFYVNELVLNLLHKHDPHSALFDAYERVVNQLSIESKLEPSLRQFEKHLLDETGYGLVLDHEGNSAKAIQSDMRYVYKLGCGAIAESNTNHPDIIFGSALINLKSNQLTNKTELTQVKRLMRRLIDVQLDGKILKSRDLFI